MPGCHKGDVNSANTSQGGSSANHGKNAWLGRFAAKAWLPTRDYASQVCLRSLTPKCSQARTGWAQAASCKRPELLLGHMRQPGMQLRKWAVVKTLIHTEPSSALRVLRTGALQHVFGHHMRYHGSTLGSLFPARR